MEGVENMDYQAEYKNLFNAITTAINILIDDVIDTSDENVGIFVPKGIYNAIHILRIAQQKAEERFIETGESDEE